MFPGRFPIPRWVNRRLRALVAGVAADRLLLRGNRIELDVGLVVGAHLKDLRGNIGANAATDAKVRVDVCFHGISSYGNHSDFAGSRQSQFEAFVCQKTPLCVSTARGFRDYDGHDPSIPALCAGINL